MERQLGYSEGHIDSVALRLFVQAYWSRVSTYAHAIHEGRERVDVDWQRADVKAWRQTVRPGINP